MSMVDTSDHCKTIGHRFQVLPSTDIDGRERIGVGDNGRVPFAIFCIQCGETRKLIFT